MFRRLSWLIGGYSVFWDSSSAVRLGLGGGAFFKGHGN